MVKRLFDSENERYTEEGIGLSREVLAAIKPVIDKYAAAGYSVRDIASIVHAEVGIVTLMKLI